MAQALNRQRSCAWCALIILGLAFPPLAAAQTASDEDARPQLAEPDFTLVSLPTTLRLPLHRSNFRLTHRFNGNLRQGDFGEQAGNLFGLDNGAAIGFEFRFAVLRRVQAAVYRTAIDKTFQFYGKYDPVRQSASMPFSFSALVSVEGVNNFRGERAPALGAVVSRTIADTVALYAAPVWVHNTAGAVGRRDTAFLGLGGTLRIRPRLYLVGEVSPRLAGYTAGKPAFGFGVETRVGGHVFQLNVSNTQATTFGQLARGGFPRTLHLGFNIGRKFY